MKEDFLHYLWKYQLFDISKLSTIQSEKISIFKTGIHNFDTGPDFLNAKIVIAGQLWFGNVEIHLKSSDWYVHNHEEDKNYDATILHVVWEYDVEVFVKDNIAVPTLELKNIVDKQILKNYKKLTSGKVSWIPCENQLKEIKPFTKQNWLERLYIERLENKSKLIHQLLKNSNNDWEQVLFILIAKNFGLKKNSEAFLLMSQSIPFTILRKEKSNQLKLEALLFGQSGMLKNTIEDSYYMNLRNEYKYLKHKYQLTEIGEKQFQFFRMRPHNFPTIRIAQLAALYRKQENLFSKLMNADSIESIYDIFQIKINDFWKNHYTFSKESKKSNKKLTRSFIDLLIVNTIIPLKFSYQKSLNTLNEEELFNLMKALKPEKNTIISKFSEFKMKAINAFESQALLELKNNYCAKKRCLQCAIGNQILKD